MGQEVVPSMNQRDLVVPAVEQELDLSAYLNALRRRWLFLVVPALATFAAICAVTFFLLPSVYRATGKILVVSQLIPSDLATSTVAASATERIKVIEQRLTTRANLLAIARKYVARSAPVVRPQPSSKAARAASTARSISSSVPAGASWITSSVAGLITGSVPPAAGSSQRPSM